MCELARNSVLQSGFPRSLKRHWLGEHYDQTGAISNDIHKTNIPDERIIYRDETLQEERHMIWVMCSS
jgi:AMP deaminase